MPRIVVVDRLQMNAAVSIRAMFFLRSQSRYMRITMIKCDVAPATIQTIPYTQRNRRQKAVLKLVPVPLKIYTTTAIMASGGYLLAKNAALDCQFTLGFFQIVLTSSSMVIKWSKTSATKETEEKYRRPVKTCATLMNSSADDMGRSVSGK